MTYPLFLLTFLSRSLGAETGIKLPTSFYKRNFTGAWNLTGGSYEGNQTSVYEFSASQNQYLSLDANIFTIYNSATSDVVNITVTDSRNNSLFLLSSFLEACKPYSSDWDAPSTCKMLLPSSYLKLTFTLYQDNAGTLPVINSFSIKTVKHWMYAKNKTTTIAPKSEPKYINFDTFKPNFTYTFEANRPMFVAFLWSVDYDEPTAVTEGILLDSDSPLVKRSLHNVFGMNGAIVNTLSIYLPHTLDLKIALVIMDASLAEFYPQMTISTPLKDIRPYKYNDLDEINNVTTYICNYTHGPSAYDIIQDVNCSDEFEFEVYEGWPWQMSEKSLLSTYNESNYQPKLPQTFSCTPKTVLLKTGICSIGTGFQFDTLTPSVNRTGFLMADNAERIYKFDESADIKLYYTFTPRVITNNESRWTMSIESRWNETVYEVIETFEPVSIMSYGITVTLNGSVTVDYKILEQPPLQTGEPQESGNPEEKSAGRSLTVPTLFLPLLSLLI